MKTIKMCLAAFMTMLGFSSCSTAPSVDINGEWQVLSIDGEELPQTMKEPLLIVNTSEKTFSGITGVNSVGGSLTYENGNIVFGEGPMTKMMADSVSMATEDKYMKALWATKSVGVAEGTLMLKDVDGNVVMTLKKK